MSQIRRLLPSLNTLVAFEAAVRCGTFARAAKELSVTSPAISRAIGRLERHLALQLFKRTPSGVELTENGSQLFAEVSKSFSSIEKALLGIQHKSSGKRLVRFSVSPAFATHWFMPRMEEFQKVFPDVELHFQFVNGPLDCPVNDVDIAMRFDPKPDDRYTIRHLMPELLLPVRSPNFDNSVDEASPGLGRMITLSGSQFHWTDILSPESLKVTANELKFSDYSVVVQAALMAKGNALGWLSVVSTLLVTGMLVPTYPVVVTTGRRCDLVVYKNSSSGLNFAICDWLKEQYQVDVLRINEKYQGLRIQI